MLPFQCYYLQKTDCAASQIYHVCLSYKSIAGDNDDKYLQTKDLMIMFPVFRLSLRLRQSKFLEAQGFSFSLGLVLDDLARFDFVNTKLLRNSLGVVVLNSSPNELFSDPLDNFFRGCFKCFLIQDGMWTSRFEKFQAAPI